MSRTHQYTKKHTQHRAWAHLSSRPHVGFVRLFRLSPAELDDGKVIFKNSEKIEPAAV